MLGGTPARIKGVINGGSVVMLIVRTTKGLRSMVFDHRPFAYWFEDTGLPNLHALLGMWVRFSDKSITLPYQTPGELIART